MDHQFYKKISPVFNNKTYLIPQPALPLQERERRRLAYRNERFLYKRKSSLSGKEIISIFHQDSPYTVFTNDEWWSDIWDPLKYGLDFEFKRTFFEQFHELQINIPRPPLVNNKAENSDYCNFTDRNKNCYLITTANDNEDSYYGFLLSKNKNAVDCLWCSDSELLYECVDCRNCYNLRFSENSEKCVESSFLLNCRDVKNSIFCINLRNKQYYILNQPYSKEDYEKKMKEIYGSYEKYNEMALMFKKFKDQFPIRKANNFTACENCTGDNIYNSKNIDYGFDVFNSHDCSYLHDGLKAVDCKDIEYFDGVELCYESTSLIGYGYRFTTFCRNSYDLFYCDNCHSCKSCFGCIGLQNKSYCILNKQFTKNDYEEIVPKIIEHMIKIGEWGEFFPIKYSLFAYNETLAQDFYPLTKEDALKKGYKWQNPEQRQYLSQNYLIPDNIKDVSDSITNEVLTCKTCGKNYRLITQELSFYRKMGLPVPRNCPDCRHNQRMSLRNPRKLWDRKCAKCGTSIKTTYFPERPEIVYCEVCYLKEVY